MALDIPFKVEWLFPRAWLSCGSVVWFREAGWYREEAVDWVKRLKLSSDFLWSTYSRMSRCHSPGLLILRIWLPGSSQRGDMSRWFSLVALNGYIHMLTYSIRNMLADSGWWFIEWSRGHFKHWIWFSQKIVWVLELMELVKELP